METFNIICFQVIHHYHWLSHLRIELSQSVERTLLGGGYQSALSYGTESMLLFRTLELLPPTNLRKAPGLLVRQANNEKFDQGHVLFVTWHEVHDTILSMAQAQPDVAFTRWWEAIHVAWFADAPLTYALLRKMIR